MADDTPANRAHNPVMACVMAGDAATTAPFRQPLASAGAEPMANAGSEASITAAIVANLMAAFLCLKLEKSARDLGSPWPLGKVQRKHFTWAPRSRG